MIFKVEVRLVDYGKTFVTQASNLVLMQLVAPGLENICPVVCRTYSLILTASWFVISFYIGLYSST